MSSELVEKIKNIQRTNPQGKLQWWNYADSEGDGHRDPTKHTDEFLQAFLDKMESGALETVQVTAEQEELCELIKLGQRKSKAWKSAWTGYCSKYGGGTNDPAKHPEKFLRGFFDFLGESFMLCYGGAAMNPMMNPMAMMGLGMMMSGGKGGMGKGGMGMDLMSMMMGGGKGKGGFGKAGKDKGMGKGSPYW